MSGEHEKKQFNYPKRDELIEQIKELDDEIEHVSLNLIKCDFNATEKDVEKAFPEYKFIKVKNYNPGSFEVVLEMKIDAINFIRNCYDRKILARRFFIKLGRQHKEVIEDWACIGYVPRNKQNNKKHFQKGPRDEAHKNKPRKEEKKAEQAGDVKAEGVKGEEKGEGKEVKEQKIEKKQKEVEQKQAEEEKPKEDEQEWTTIPVKGKGKKR